MRDLVLNSSDNLETNILKIIDFVKQVEREYGLSDEEIEYKYSCGCCGVLALDIIKTTLENFFGDIDELEGFAIKTGNKKIPSHNYLKLKGKTPNKDIYFDIFGKKSLDEVNDFIKSNYWDKEFKKPWVGTFEKTHDLGDYMYVQYECLTNIFLESLTV